jgi:acyl-CoA synthetase (AMP-forming)/AMP-acid ligase II
MRDVEALEARGDPELPGSTYALIARGASLEPGAPALSFFRTVEEHRRPETWTYGELLARITRTANFFHRLGSTKDTVIAVVLPHLPALKQREAKDALETALREAGVAFSALEMTADPARGTTVHVELNAAASSDAARQVLGRFPLPFTIRVIE